MASGSLSEHTPLMKQYYELKKTAHDAFLFFRMGDFYEFFGDDAKKASEILGITLTSRDKGKADPLPMAGVPYHSAQGYIQKLLKAGYKVAIAEQLEEATAGAKEIVKRGIIRTFTPAIQFEGSGLDQNFLAVLVPHEKTSELTLCAFEPSTGEVIVSLPLSREAMASVCLQLPIKHFLNSKLLSDSGFEGILTEELPSNYFNLEQSERLLKELYKLETLSVIFGSSEQIFGVGTLIHYTKKNIGAENLSYLQSPRLLQEKSNLLLGPKTALHLSLVPSYESEPNLFAWLNRTSSSSGARELKRLMLEPLCEIVPILKRQDAVKELALEFHLRLSIKNFLKETYDLERLNARIHTRLANPRDTLAIGKTLAQLKPLAIYLKDVKSEALQEILQEVSDLDLLLSRLAEKILREQKEDAPFVVRDGGIFNPGTDEELDRLLELNLNGTNWLIEFEKRERDATGISSLKVRYNRVFGYYIEITSAHLKSAPAHYQRKQTMVGAERFFTEELKRFEEEILTSGTKQKNLEIELFARLIEIISEASAHLIRVSKVFSKLDALCALSQLCDDPGFCFPVIDDSLTLDITEGRHPLVDAASNGKFTPNSVQLGEATRLALLISGPNMGGKSTLMRQIAIIVVLGQMGAPVPAKAAHFGVFHSIYTRIGANDAIAAGQSTFMVEMTELAHILRHANSRSLLILDEIGRGTSTYDGMSVAWATLEHLTQKIRARVFFATHYHELTHLAEKLPGLANAHLAVESDAKTRTLRFLYRLREGATSDSFGVYVAQLAGIPESVVNRASKILKTLESGKKQNHVNAAQLSLFDVGSFDSSEKTEVADERVVNEKLIFKKPEYLGLIDRANINEMTPLQALTLLSELKRLHETNESV